MLFASRYYRPFWEAGFGAQCGVLVLPHNEKVAAEQRQISARLKASENWVRLLQGRQLTAISGLQHTAECGLFFPQLGWLPPVDICGELLRHPKIQLLRGQVERLVYCDTNKRWSFLDGADKAIAEAPIAVVASAFGCRQFAQTEFLPVAKRLLGDWSEGLEDLRQLFTLQRGKISVAAMPSYASNCLPSVLAEYGQHFPNIAVTVLDVVMEEVIESVQSGRAELGITFRPDMLDGVDFQPLFSDRFIAVLPPQHRLIEKPQLRLKDLLSGTLVALNRGSSTRQWTDELIVKARLQPPQIFEAYQLTTVGAMVAAGLGVGLVPALCAGQMSGLGAVCRPISGPSIEREVGVFTRRRHALSSAAQALLKLLLPLY